MTILLVPIALDVLMVRQVGAAEDWALTALNVPAKKQGRPKKHQLVPDPFQCLPQARPAGAYLHWAVPDALAKGAAAGNSGQKFPPLPDRWLIMRLSGAPGSAQRQVAAWLLPDSGAESPVCIPVAAGMPPPAPAANDLTAIGFGDPAWSGYYDNVINRFGMYDALQGVTGPIAYAVCGWYSDAGKDPIASSSETEFNDKLVALAWKLDKELPSGTPYPVQSVYHGMAVSIGWPDPRWINDTGGVLGTETDLKPAPSQTIEVALGETFAEAVAAAIAPADAEPGVGTLIEGALKGLVADPANPDGPAVLDTALHVSRFGSKPSGKLLFSVDAKYRSDLNSGTLPGPVQKGFIDHGVLVAADNVIEVIVETRDIQWWINIHNSDGSIRDSYSAAKEKQRINIYTVAHTEHIWQPAPAALERDSSSGSLVPVRRTLPRVWHALDPSIVIHGGGSSPRHGGDGRYTASGDLVCRIAGQTLTAFGVAGGNPGKGSDVLPASPLAALPGSYGAPPAAYDILVELACLDPGSAPDFPPSPPSPSPVARMRAQWWSSFDPAAGSVTPVGASWEGSFPSPIGVTIPLRPWTPLHLEWAASYLPSPRGAHDWHLAAVDFDLPEEVDRPDPDPAHPLRGRIRLNNTPSSMLNEVTSQIDGTDTHADADLLGGNMSGIFEQLRGDWIGAIVRGQGNTTQLKEDPRPDGFTALRAGFLKLDRLRLVDGFGQYRDLLGGTPVNSVRLMFGSSLSVPAQPDLAALRPRFTAPARVLFRFVDGSGTQVEAGPGVSPVCGYVLPSLLDSTLELFDAEGNGLGQLRPDQTSGIAWEEDPGQSSTLGRLPSSAMPKASFLGALADGIVAADTALSQLSRTGPAGVAMKTSLNSLLTVLDITRWTVDLSGSAGDEHLSLLLGHPVAVVRAAIKIEVQDPRNPPENETTSVPVKLGTLAHLQDGLLAYYVADDYSRVFVVDPSLARIMPAAGFGSIDSPYVDKSGVFYVNPGQVVPLTLLMMPGTDVHVTTGMLPQKKVGLMREWTAPALSRISPSLRRGPILRDESATRIPLPADIRANWFWHRRSDPSTWAADQVVAATGEAIMPEEPVQASDGWLRASVIPDAAYSTSPQQVQITFIRSKKSKSGRQVLAVGGKNADGTAYLLPVEQAVQMQESGRFIFYVELDPPFQKDDLKELPSFAQKLKQTPDDVSTYVASRLSGPTKQALEQYQGRKSDPGNLPELLVSDLNTIIAGSGLFVKDRFSSVTLRPETQQLLKKENLAGVELEQLNRLLLEDAFSKELRRIRVYVKVIKLPNRTKYLRTTRDVKGRNNLLNMPEYTAPV